MYDELTINDRQKKDGEFSNILDCVRRVSPTEDTLRTLQDRAINVSVPEMFSALQEKGVVPVCLFFPPESSETI